MILLANVFIVLGLIGFLTSTFALPVLVRIISFLIPKSTAFFRSDDDISLDLLVAAYNEETLILPTLESLNHAAKFSKAKIQFRVGVDHCTDQTEALVLDWANKSKVSLEIIQNLNSPGKWNNLKSLIASSEAEWIGLVDVGSVWQSRLLQAVHESFTNPQVMGIAPSYRAVRSGILERLSWWMERTLKSLESDAGGPVSVHGATVFYRREKLVIILDQLGHQAWLNDDIVLPLQLRATFPELQLVYFSHSNGDAWVRDYGTSDKRNSEYGRRKRMLIGNLQWMKALYLPTFKRNKLAGLLATRRVARAFWAYWLSALMLGITFRTMMIFSAPFLGMTFALVGVAVGAKLPLHGSGERLRGAFYAGLELPLHWFNWTQRSSEKIWN